MLRHDNVAEDVEDILAAGAFERLQEEIARAGRGEIGQAAVATEGEEMRVPACW